MKLKGYAKSLRNNSTDAEATLWYYLRAKRLNGLKFKRQQPMGKYIVDFICFEKKVIVELDGSQHLQNDTYDKKRDEWLESQGYHVMRFNNIEFFEHKEAVIEKIAETCLEEPPLSVSLPQGERGLSE
jgi:very-short-patch-repair endonuclease